MSLSDLVGKKWVGSEETPEGAGQKMIYEFISNNEFAQHTNMNKIHGEYLIKWTNEEEKDLSQPQPTWFMSQEGSIFTYLQYSSEEKKLFLFAQAPDPTQAPPAQPTQVPIEMCIKITFTETDDVNDVFDCDKSMFETPEEQRVCMAIDECAKKAVQVIGTLEGINDPNAMLEHPEVQVVMLLTPPQFGVNLASVMNYSQNSTVVQQASERMQAALEMAVQDRMAKNMAILKERYERANPAVAPEQKVVETVKKPKPAVKKAKKSKKKKGSSSSLLIGLGIATTVAAVGALFFWKSQQQSQQAEK